jgi:hypothetical protein
MSNSKQHISKSKLWTRILCIILAVLMVGSVAYLAVTLIIDTIRSGKPATKAAVALSISAPVFTITSADNFYDF